MLAGWDHFRGPEPALSSINGRERRSRQLDSIRTFWPILVALPVACDTPSLAGGRVPMSSPSDAHRGACVAPRHAWENGGGTGAHGARRELADGRRTAAR